jgi:hypothetical protein
MPGRSARAVCVSSLRASRASDHAPPGSAEAGSRPQGWRSGCPWRSTRVRPCRHSSSEQNAAESLSCHHRNSPFHHLPGSERDVTPVVFAVDISLQVTMSFLFSREALRGEWKMGPGSGPVAASRAGYSSSQHWAGLPGLRNKGAKSLWRRARAETGSDSEDHPGAHGVVSAGHGPVLRTPHRPDLGGRRDPP